jgi:hypothetical protein
MSTNAVTDLNVLDGLNRALRKWVDIQFNDKTNTVVGLKEHVMENDLPQMRRVRWYAMHDEVHAADLWQRYVENVELEGELKETVFDFYVTGASYIWLNTPTATANYDAFIEHLASNLSWLARCKLVPGDIRQYAATHEQVTEFLKGNHWAVFLILLSMLDLQ